MGRPSTPIIDKAINTTTILEDTLRDMLFSDCGNDDRLKSEVSQLITYASIINGKLRKLQRLFGVIGSNFAIINPETGEIRRASYDETIRAIMGYLQPGKDVINELNRQADLWRRFLESQSR